MKDTRYEIFLGLNQKDTGENFSKDEVKKQIEEVFIKYAIDFSLNFQVGGYIHEDSTYVLEEGIRMTFIGKRTLEEEKEFFEDLKKTFNQESILVIKKQIEASFE